MLEEKDIRQIEERGSSVKTVEEQVERFKKSVDEDCGSCYS